MSGVGRTPTQKEQIAPVFKKELPAQERKCIMDVPVLATVLADALADWDRTVLGKE